MLDCGTIINNTGRIVNLNLLAGELNVPVAQRQPHFSNFAGHRQVLINNFP